MVKRVVGSYLESAEDPADAHLVFFRGLWAIQSDIEAIERDYAVPDAEAARDARDGTTAVSSQRPIVPLAAYVDAATAIAVYVSEGAGLPQEQAEALRSADLAAAITDGRLECAVRAPDAFFAAVAAALGVDGDGPLTYMTVAFVLASALVPF